MNNLQLSDRARRLHLRQIRNYHFSRQQRGAQNSNSTHTSLNMSYTLRGLSKWSIEGLDLSDSGFSKLHDKESKFESSKTKYDLAPEKFKDYANDLIEKVERIHAIQECTVTTTGTNTKYVLKEYSSLTAAQMTAAKNTRWPAQLPSTVTDQATADQFTDSQIKASVLGAYIHDSLTGAAKNQLKADSDLFKVVDVSGNKYFDGPSYFHCIARLVDPDNGHLVANTKTYLRTLNIKDFGYDAKKMLAEFKNLKTRVTDLGGDYSTDEQFLDLWSCVRTMKEKEFNRFVRELRDQEARKAKANRASIDEIIREIADKQTRMETDHEWNVMSQEDTMIMALAGMLESVQPPVKKKSKKSNKSGDESKTTSNEKDNKDSKPKSKDDRFPEWKKTPPTGTESRSKIVNNRTYYWCTKCRDGKGLWAMHEVHDDNFVPSSQRKSYKSALTTEQESTDSEKKVSFNTEPVVNESESESEPQIQVKSQLLLNNTKAYLSQFQDFQKGGLQG